MTRHFMGQNTELLDALADLVEAAIRERVAALPRAQSDVGPMLKRWVSVPSASGRYDTVVDRADLLRVLGAEPK